MKRFFSIFLLLARLPALAQFESTDQLRQYNNNNIRSNGHQGVTASMLNNLHAGMLDFIDTALLNRANALIISNDTIYLVFGSGATMPIVLPAQINSDWNATTGPAVILNKPTIPAAQVNSDWDATTGPAMILNKPGTPTLSDVLSAGNVAIAGTSGQPPMVMQQGDLTVTPQPGAVEYDGLALYITDDQSVRHNLTQTDRVFKVYPWDYNQDTLYFGLTGWNAQYVDDPTYAPTVISTIFVEITVAAGTPAGAVISAIFEGQTIYTLTVTAQTSADYYVVGTLQVNQDIKYPQIFYIKGAAETLNGSGLVQTTNTAFLFTSDGFTNPYLAFGTTSTSLARIGCTYTVDQKQQGRWIFSPQAPPSSPTQPTGGG